MLLQTIIQGDYQAKLFKTREGYSYKIFYKLNGKNTCVARSYAYILDKGICYEQMMNELKVTMGIVKTLLD